MYKSTKVIDGFSTCFRQWKSNTHCNQLHGYALKFKLVFKAETLDDKNWVQDFGFLKSSTFEFDGVPISVWFRYMFDHTTVISRDDPARKELHNLAMSKVLTLRELDNVGCEAFAELVHVVISLMLKHDHKDGRVTLESVECIEHEKNSAIYEKR